MIATRAGFGVGVRVATIASLATSVAVTYGISVPNNYDCKNDVKTIRICGRDNGKGPKRRPRNQMCLGCGAKNKRCQCQGFK